VYQYSTCSAIAARIYAYSGNLRQKIAENHTVITLFGKMRQIFAERWHFLPYFAESCRKCAAIAEKKSFGLA
jgi:hypothetical protein